MELATSSKESYRESDEDGMPSQEEKKKHELIAIHTDSSVRKNDEKTRVIYPFNLKATAGILPLRECSLDIPRLELFGEPCQSKYPRNASRKLRKRSCHVWYEGEV